MARLLLLLAAAAAAQPQRLLRKGRSLAQSSAFDDPDGDATQIAEDVEAPTREDFALEQAMQPKPKPVKPQHTASGPKVEVVNVVMHRKAPKPALAQRRAAVAVDQQIAAQQRLLAAAAAQQRQAAAQAQATAQFEAQRTAAMQQAAMQASAGQGKRRAIKELSARVRKERQATYYQNEALEPGVRVKQPLARPKGWGQCLQFARYLKTKGTTGEELVRAWKSTCEPAIQSGIATERYRLMCNSLGGAVRPFAAQIDYNVENLCDSVLAVFHDLTATDVAATMA